MHPRQSETIRAFLKCSFFVAERRGANQQSGDGDEENGPLLSAPELLRDLQRQNATVWGDTQPGAASCLPAGNRATSSLQALPSWCCSPVQPDHAEMPWRHIIFAPLSNLPLQQKHCNHGHIVKASPLSSSLTEAAVIRQCCIVGFGVDSWFASISVSLREVFLSIKFQKENPNNCLWGERAYRGEVF